MAPGGSQKKVANSLVTLSSAAILAIYAAGFIKTRAAATQLDEAANERRPPMPAPVTAGEDVTPDPIEPTAPAATPTVAKSPAVVAPRMKRPVPVAERAIETAAIETVVSAPVVATPPVVPEPAKAVAEEPVAAALLMPKEAYKDGTYLGWGTSRHGDIQASVTVTDGRLVSATIAQCRTRYSCSWVAHLPPQVIARQSPEVDFVSGATQSANAFYWAVVDALKKAK